MNETTLASRGHQERGSFDVEHYMYLRVLGTITLPSFKVKYFNAEINQLLKRLDYNKKFRIIFAGQLPHCYYRTLFANSVRLIFLFVFISKVTKQMSRRGYYLRLFKDVNYNS